MTTGAPYLIFLATIQPKATSPEFTKPNQQVKMFFMQILTRGDADGSKNRKFQGDTQQYAVVEQENEALHRYRCQNTQNQNLQNQL